MKGFSSKRPTLPGLKGHVLGAAELYGFAWGTWFAPLVGQAVALVVQEVALVAEGVALMAQLFPGHPIDEGFFE